MNSGEPVRTPVSARSSAPTHAELPHPLRLSPVELSALAALGGRANEGQMYAAMPATDSEDERAKFELKQAELDREGLERRNRALEELRQELVARETEAYRRGVASATDKDAVRASNARSVVLFLVVLAVVLMPVIAIIMGLDSETFGAFIAPITGIAGTIVGFWFSSGTTKSQ